MPNDSTDFVPYARLDAQQQDQMREYILAAWERFATYRDNKETLAFAGLAIFLAAVATVLSSETWPPAYVKSWPRYKWLVSIAFLGFWLFVATYLRYQLRERRWAAFRIAGCDWLLAEWLPNSPKAMEEDVAMPARPPRPGFVVLLLDLICPLKRSVAGIDTSIGRRVYPAEIERAWVSATFRDTRVLFHERIIHLAGWIGFFAVLLRTILASSPRP